MYQLRSSLLVFCFLGLAEFALESQGAGLLSCFCGGGGEGATSDERGTRRGGTGNWRDRPNVPADLNELSELNANMRNVDSNAGPLSTTISLSSVAACIALNMRNKLNPNVSSQGFDTRAREKIITPCSRLNQVLGSWYDELDNEGHLYNPDGWYFTMRICREILGRTEQELLSTAYTKFQEGYVEGNFE